MRVTVTVRLKLDMTADASDLLSATSAAYRRALNMSSRVAFDGRCKNAAVLHHLTYRQVRQSTNLRANLACSAINVVARAYNRTPDKLHKWKEGASVGYDARTLTLKPADSLATLSTVNERVAVGLIIGDYHKQYFNEQWKIAGNALLKQQGRAWYLHLVATRDVPDAQGSNVVGLDAGIKRIAVLSTGKTFNGGSIAQLRRRRSRQRQSLQRIPEGQSKSRAQRRLLKRLSGTEKRAVAWKLWNVANEVVREAGRTNSRVIAIEDLKHIASRITVARKQRAVFHTWPYASLFSKLRHVASRQGIAVVEVSARNTSRTCSRCGHCDKASRKTQSTFHCVSCGYSHNADLNAAFNIRGRYVAQGLGDRKPSLTSVAAGSRRDRAEVASATVY